MIKKIVLAGLKKDRAGACPDFVPKDSVRGKTRSEGFNPRPSSVGTALVAVLFISKCFGCHCEERSDEAISSKFAT